MGLLNQIFTLQTVLEYPGLFFQACNLLSGRGDGRVELAGISGGREGRGRSISFLFWSWLSIARTPLFQNRPLRTDF